MNDTPSSSLFGRGPKKKKNTTPATTPPGEEPGGRGATGEDLSDLFDENGELILEDTSRIAGAEPTAADDLPNPEPHAPAEDPWAEETASAEPAAVDDDPDTRSSDDEPPSADAPPAAPVTAARARPAPGSRPALEFAFDARGARRPPRAPRAPFVIALLGDFSGRASRGIVEPVAGRPPIAVDLDSFDDVLARCSPVLTLPDPGAPDETVELVFSELDAFHPDQIVPQLPVLQRLRRLRPQLLAASTAPKAAKQLQALLSTPLPRPPKRVAAARPDEDDAATLARLLGKAPPPAPARTAPVASARHTVEQLVQNAVAGSVVQNPTAHQQQLVAALDAASAEQLRACICHPLFQEIEALWRSVDLLVRTCDEADNVKLLLVDVSREELAADQAAAGEVTSSGFYKLLYDATSEQAWVAAAALYTFGESPEDLALAGQIALAGAYLSTPIVAGAHPWLLGCGSLAQTPDPDDWTSLEGTDLSAAWSELRARPEAAFLALALPRFLLRQPYGKGSDPIDAFPFEEVPGPEAHESYLWGNPAVLITQLLIERFQADGWDLSPTTGGDVGGLPVHHYKAGGESLVKPCAEAWLVERAAAAIQRAGLIPVLSVKNRDAVRVVRLNSISAENAPLPLRVS
jgi:type VI secretion system protein ImpC